MAASNLPDCDLFASRLLDETLDIKLKQNIATELRDSVEVFQNAEYPRFLQVMMPVFRKILNDTQPVFISNDPNQKLRNVTLEILHRLPQNEALRPHAPDLLKLVMELLRNENEDNAVICLKIIIDLHRGYKHQLEDQVQPFLDIVQEMYRNMEQTVREVFDTTTAPSNMPPQVPQSPRPSSPTSDTSEIQPNKTLAKSLYSFKVLTECPIIVVLLFQSHRQSIQNQFVQNNIQNFVPLIIETLGLQAAPQAEAQEAARQAGDIFAGVAPGIRDRVRYTEFIVAQVKTMSFLAYVLRAYTSALNEYQDKIPNFVIRLLQDCPPEASATRKELLVATRHILSTDFRNNFVSKIDILLKEKVLVGTGVTSYETLRPLAYSMLADLVHHVRDKLTSEQLAQTIYIYSLNVHDPTLNPYIQTMCSKILLNMIERVMLINPREQKRELLIKIFDTFTNKFVSLNVMFPDLIRQLQKRKGTILPPGPKWEEFDFEQSRPIATSVPSSQDPQHDPLDERKFLIKNLVIGLREIMKGLKQCNPPAPQHENSQTWNSVARGFSHDETAIFITLFREGIKAFDYFTIDKDGNTSVKPPEKGLASDTNRMGPQSRPEKDTLEQFAGIFTLVDPALFQEIFGSQMNYFYMQTLRNTSLLQIPQFFLSVAETISENYAGILFRFLVDRLDKLGGPDPLYASVMLRLFRLAFMAVTYFPNVNEMVLHPHLGKIIMSSIKLSAKAKEPINYFHLLRALFRSIGGGRFELLYKEVLPLLQVLLEGLNSLLSLTHKQKMRDLFVELCLTVPVRLSVLLPYLSYLTKPLVLALQAGPELVAQGLRTLELCIDNLTPEFLDPIMAPVINDLMLALWKHLRPTPYNQNHSIVAARILGKLGGRNRRLLKDPPKLSSATPPINGLDVQIYFDLNSPPNSLPLDECLTLAAKTLDDCNATAYYKKQAFKFLVASVPLLLDLDEGPDDLAKRITERVQRRLFQTDEQPNPGDPSATVIKMEVDEYRDLTPQGVMKPARPEGHKHSLRRKVVQEEILRHLLCALFTAASLPDVKDEAWPYLQNICRHFALLELSDAVDHQILRKKRIIFEENNKVFNLEAKILVEALVEVLATDDPEIRKVAELSLKIIYDTCVLVSGSRDAIRLLPLFHVLASRFCSCCYKQEWYRKSGGCFGISILSSVIDMGTQWMIDHELEFVKSLLSIMKDTSSEFATGSVEDATKTFLRVLEVCNCPDSGGKTRERDPKFNRLVQHLILELACPNNAVRESVQAGFKLLAELHGCEVTDILSPVKDILLGSIFAKPLRAIPLQMQIGNIDAITYALTLRPPLVESGDELNRIVNDSLQLAEAEEQALGSRPTNYRNSASVTNLRIVCIKFLTAAMMVPDSLTTKQSPIRARIIGVFFKSLYHRVPEIVEVSNKGLAAVLHQQKLQKDLLQAGLRPILVNLGDSRKLNVAGLEGLARLLELLTNYFKVQIGEKLLDHLPPWADQKTLQEAANKPLEEIESIKIIIAILNVYHLLPPAANVFMDKLIVIVLDLEEKLRRGTVSPFRLPLIKFFNKYSTEAVEYFYNKITERKYIDFFVDIIGTEEATKVRQEIMDNPTKLIASTTMHLEDSQAHFKRILIIRAISRFNPEWLKHETIINEIREAWHEAWDTNPSRRADEMRMNVTEIREYQNIIEVGLAYMRANPDDVSLMYEFVAIFTRKSVIDYHFLRKFFYEEVAMNYSAARKRAVVDKFVDMFDDPFKNNARIKTAAARYIVNPLLMYTFTQGPQEYNQIIDLPMITKMHKSIWQQGGVGPDDIDDPLRIELFQMTTLLVQYVPHLIDNVRRDVIFFGWKSLNIDDVTTKQASYVLCARFIAAYEFPGKLIHNAYMALLRAHQLEARTLVKQALDIVTPVLTRRLEEAEHSHPQHLQRSHLPSGRVKSQQQQSSVSWTTWTKKVLLEDGYSVSQLVNVYQLLVRHPDLFYDSRQQFLPQIINTLTRLGLLQNATNETRSLTIDLAELILRWEKRRIAEQLHRQENSTTSTPSASISSPGKRRMEIETESSPRKRQQLEHGGEMRILQVESGGAEPYTPNLNLRENVVSYLVRFVCSASEAVSKVPGGLPHRALQLVKEFLQPEFWPEVNIKLQHFERTLMSDITNSNTQDNFCNGLDVLNVILDRKPADWCLANIGHLQKLLDKSLGNNNSRIQQCLNPVLVHIYQALSNVESSTEENLEIANFTSIIDKAIEEDLEKMDKLYASLMLLNAVKSKNPENIDNFLGGIMSVVSKLVKEHLTAPNSGTNTNNHNSGTNTNNQPDSVVKMLIMSLQIMNSRISNLAENWNHFLQALCQLLDKTKDAELARAIFEMAKQWVINSKRDSFPTMKDIARVLNKMLSFEALGDKALLEDYLDLVITIYSDVYFSRSDLTVKLEQSFLMGTRNENPTIRNRFMKILDRSIATRLSNRLTYVVGTQNWEYLGNYFWLHQALDILLGAISRKQKILPPAYSLRTKSITRLGEAHSDSSESFIVTNEFEGFIQTHKQFLRDCSKMTILDLLVPLKQLHYLDDRVAYKLWVDLFPICWSSITLKDRQGLTNKLVTLLAKEYHNIQADLRPNCIQALLEGISHCPNKIKLPPYLVKYLGKTHCSWHIALEILQYYALEAYRDEEQFRESTLDALAEIYSTLSEDDMLAGLWRRRSIRIETNIAVSYEQCGMWADAQISYETAQTKGRSAPASFTDQEYLLWEEHWLECSKKLQQWDVLTDFAKNEGNTELLLECAWRISDWTEDRELLDQAISSLSDRATPKSRVFEAFMSLVKSRPSNDFSEVKKISDESVQLSLRRWHALPEVVAQSHVPLLQVFQQFVELEEATKMCAGLDAALETSNTESKTQELKSVLSGWKERLPNTWDDINIWSDLVAWRRHIFRMINEAFKPYQALTPPGNAISSINFAFRGHHETAWIINRFAHVARKHRLSEVCVNFLQHIYSLPNIEIQEAFIKLKEQAKCHYQNPGEVYQALDVINNTNLNYFGPHQKAEFHTLKGMVMAKLDRDVEANSSFATAVQVDMRLPKAWAEWGRYNDRKFKDDPSDISLAAHALSCYLQAAGLYNSHKCRKLLVRILWLLSLDDAQGQIARVFEGYMAKGEVPVWYWITFIPQLLVALTRPEARHAKTLLARIAKMYPQALHFQLRTAKDEYSLFKKQYTGRAQNSPSVPGTPGTPSTATSGTPSGGNEGFPMPQTPQMSTGIITNGTPSGADLSRPVITPNNIHPVSNQATTPLPNGNNIHTMPSQATPLHPKPWEHAEEIMSTLKGAFPFLTLTMETLVEHIQQKLKPTSDEDIYRLIASLLNDGILQLLRTGDLNDGGSLNQGTETNIRRFAENLYASLIKVAFEEDFIKSKPNLCQYVEKLRKWRDRFEILLDSKPRKQHLEHYSQFLVEFQHQKFDDIEIPGQYLLHKDHHNTDFVRIDRFLPEIDIVRIHGFCYRRLTIRGHDGSLHPFAIYQPAAAHSRREERIMQFFRILNSVLERRRETRKRNLFFHLPLVIPLAPQVRMIQDDPSYSSLQDIYEDHCDTTGIGKDDPIIYHTNKIRSSLSLIKERAESTNLRAEEEIATRIIQTNNIVKRNEVVNLKVEIAEEIATKMIPNNVLTKYMTKSMKSHMDLWIIRKQFTTQMAGLAFMSYIFSIGQRHPHKIIIAKNTGNIWTTELLPSFSLKGPQFLNRESVPFRLTRGIQNFITPIGIEGVFTGSLMAIARSLTDPEFELDQHLSIFVLDELITWCLVNRSKFSNRQTFVARNVEIIVKLAEKLACKDHERDKNNRIPVVKPILDLIDSASNPQNLAEMDPTWLQWL